MLWVYFCVTGSNRGAAVLAVSIRLLSWQPRAVVGQTGTKPSPASKETWAGEHQYLWFHSAPLRHFHHLSLCVTLRSVIAVVFSFVWLWSFCHCSQTICAIRDGLSDPLVRTGHKLSLHQRAVRMKESASFKKYRLQLKDLPTIQVQDVNHVSLAQYVSIWVSCWVYVK